MLRQRFARNCFWWEIAKLLSGFTMPRRPGRRRGKTLGRVCYRSSFASGSRAVRRPVHGSRDKKTVLRRLVTVSICKRLHTYWKPPLHIYLLSQRDDDNPSPTARDVSLKVWEQSLDTNASICIGNLSCMCILTRGW